MNAVEGRGLLVSVFGEAGVGKTALVHTFADAVSGRARVLWGACEDLSTPEPLGPLRDLARTAKYQGLEFDGTARRLTTFSHALEFLNDGPTLAVIEDLHWADDATMDFVRYLGRRIRDTHIMLLVTARDEDADAQARLRRILVDVPTENCERIHVPRLSQAAVNKLARDAGCNAGDLFATTGGNAFFITEALRGTAKEALPATVRDAVLLRAARLSDDARCVLDGAAIFPRRVEPEILSELCQPTSAAGIDECVAAGMLQLGDQGYAFRHEIARRMIEATLSPARRRSLNARALELLRRDPASPVARLFHHACEARDAAAIRDLAPRAADGAARVGAHREAARHYATALAPRRNVRSRPAREALQR
jgi:predicted ATPase